MPQIQYALWLAECTFPADDHKLRRHVVLESPDDLLNLLKNVIPGLNKDMRVVAEPLRFDVTDREGFEAAHKAADARDRAQPGWKAPGRYDLSLNQEQVDKIKADRDAALAALLPSATTRPAPPTPA